jgi:hypothetical protein
MFNGSIKYIDYYKNVDLNNLTEKNEIDNMVENKIINKVKEFIAPKQISIDLALINIKNMINKKYKISELSKIIQWCPLQYFVIKFLDNNKYFKMKMLFPFLKNVINRKLKIDEIDNFFKNEKYLKSLIENDTIKGDYFEASVKLGLKNNFDLSINIDKEITLKEIVTMNINENYNDEIIDDNIDDAIVDDINDDNNDNYEENKNENNIESNDEIIIEEEKYTTFSKDEEKMRLINELAKIYSIDLKKTINENNIEKYRINELVRISNDNKNIIISNYNFDGKKNYLIDQTNKKGRLLDYSLL